MDVMASQSQTSMPRPPVHRDGTLAVKIVGKVQHAEHSRVHYLTFWSARFTIDEGAQLSSLPFGTVARSSGNARLRESEL